ncbi:hypothetical protein ACFXDE_01915 [Kitasatospora sp. NPDC059408]|uniref:hypothetical protein n=1 Tax=Kitasatospora sp. NPDC059408 TaxID=3346823 RepID=UPI00367CDE59
MSTHYATGDVWIGNVDSEDEVEHIAEIIDTALGAAGYHATVTVTAGSYGTAGGDR